MIGHVQKFDVSLNKKINFIPHFARKILILYFNWPRPLVSVHPYEIEKLLPALMNKKQLLIYKVRVIHHMLYEILPFW